MKRNLVQLSKLISYILRHKPDSIGLNLDSEGWAIIDDLINKCNASGNSLDKNILIELVKDNDKKRFSISADGHRIRANQGHSIPVNLSLTEQEPPSILYHGTSNRYLSSILKSGLKPQSRHHVHLSTNEITALRVGQRHGEPALLKIESYYMYSEGFKFFITTNSIWLTDHVPPEYLSLHSSHSTDSAITSVQPISSK